MQQDDLQQDYFGVGVVSRALDIVGGAFALAEHLGVHEHEISEWLAFRKPIPLGKPRSRLPRLLFLRF